MNKLMSSLLPQNTTINGTVQKRDLEVFIVSNNGISFKAKKAFSCLVEPMIDDRVSLCVNDKEIYIVAILERKKESRIDIIAKNGINIIAQEGDITLNAEESINGFSQKANIVISEVSFLSTVMTLKSHTINVVAGIYKGFMDAVTLKHKSLNKFVDGHEEHQSKSSRRLIQGSDIHQVEESITIVDGQMKIDAKLINMG